MRVKSIRGRQGGKLEGIFVVEIKTEINDSGKGELERGCLIFKTTLRQWWGGSLVFLAPQPALRLGAEA